MKYMGVRQIGEIKEKRYANDLTTTHALATFGRITVKNELDV